MEECMRKSLWAFFVISLLTNIVAASELVDCEDKWGLLGAEGDYEWRNLMRDIVEVTTTREMLEDSTNRIDDYAPFCPCNCDRPIVCEPCPNNRLFLPISDYSPLPMQLLPEASSSEAAIQVEPTTNLGSAPTKAFKKLTFTAVSQGATQTHRKKRSLYDEQFYEFAKNRPQKPTCAPVQDALLFCVLMERGGIIDDKIEGSIEVMNFDELLSCIDDNIDRKRSVGKRSRIKSLKQFYDDISENTHGNFIMRIKENRHEVFITSFKKGHKRLRKATEAFTSLQQPSSY
jgi:hypothetical protein